MATRRSAQEQNSPGALRADYFLDEPLLPWPTIRRTLATGSAFSPRRPMAKESASAIAA